MGVRGLTSYLENSDPPLGRQFKLHSTKLIIDGDSLCNHLYEKNRLDCRCGGQYAEFYEIVLSFFDTLQSERVKSFVVLDGAYDRSDKKLETKKERAQKRIETANRLFKDERPPRGGKDFLLPLLAKFVFAQVLKDHQIKFAVSDCEADPDIASLARDWKCPVLSNDSDFFIFDVKGGFIPLSSFDIDHLTCRIFYRSNLARYFGIREELLPLFASLLGNDYVSQEALEPFNPTGTWGREKILRVASMLRNYPDSITETDAIEKALESIEPGKSRERLQQAVENSIQEYTVTKSNVLNYFRDGAVCSLLRTQNNLKLDEEVLRMFRKGNFSTDAMSSLTAGKVFLKVQVEDHESRSSNQSSMSLRQLAYDILSDKGRNMKKVEEWDRKGIAIKHTDIKLHNDGVPLLSTDPSLDRQEKLTLFLDALDSDTAYIKSLPKELTLVASSLRFLLRKAQPRPTSHLPAILWSCVLSKDDSWKKYLESKKSRSQPFDERAAQSFCQWQCAVRDAIDLNFILSEPVQTPCIQKIFNGPLAHCLQEDLKGGVKPGTSLWTLCTPSKSRCMELLYTAITDREGADPQSYSPVPEDIQRFIPFFHQHVSDQGGAPDGPYYGGGEYEPPIHDKGGVDPQSYSPVPEEIQRFIHFFHQHVTDQNLYDIQFIYETNFNRLTERYFEKDPWPEPESVASLVDGDQVFLILYKELYYRHIYNKLKPTLEHHFESYFNYCDLFNYILNTDEPVPLTLPNQWLWDIIDEFIYQFQAFSQYRSKLLKKGEDEVGTLRANTKIWNVHSVLNVLYSLVEKSKINHQLEKYNQGGDPDSVAGEFGIHPLYKMLGYFSLIGLLRLHSLLGDYFQAIKVLENVELNKKSLYSRVPACQITTYYYVGFAYLMMKRYQDAIRSFSNILLYIQRTKNMFQTKSYQYEQIMKKNDQMYVLLAICLTLCPQRIDENVHSQLREKNADRLQRLQRGDLQTFEESFSYACPKFISPVPPNFDAPPANFNREPFNLQLKVFMNEVSQQSLIPVMRSYLKLYTTMPIAKLAAFLDMDKSQFRTQLLCFKHKQRNLVWTKGTDALEGELQSSSEVDFYIDQDMIHIADTKVERRYGDFFIRQIHKFEEVTRNIQAVQ